MLAADMEWASFDWSQFDTGEQFDFEAVAAGNFGDQFSQMDENWYFDAGVEEPLPSETETQLPEGVGGDTAAEATVDAWGITDPTFTDSTFTDSTFTDSTFTDSATTDSATTDSATTDTATTDTATTDTATTDTTTTDTGFTDPAENVTSVESGEDFPLPLPVETEPSTLEPPLSSDDVAAEIDGTGFGGDGYGDAVDPVDTSYDTGETVSDTTGLDPAETLSAQADEGDVPDDTASVDDLQLGAGSEGFSEETASALPDIPVATAATSSGSAGVPRAASAPRSAAFSMMSMFAGFSFSTLQDDAADGPIFAGGRRRARR